MWGVPNFPLRFISLFRIVDGGWHVDLKLKHLMKHFGVRDHPHFEGVCSVICCVSDMFIVNTEVNCRHG